MKPRLNWAPLHFNTCVSGLKAPIYIGKIRVNNFWSNKVVLKCHQSNLKKLKLIILFVYSSTLYAKGNE